ncbi:MAG: LruC domain-containing protein [Candidatus Cloacimonetes bacterium]|nr:LruC domain-containing protein [Candidatus Cloacimonadota bacterium]
MIKKMRLVVFLAAIMLIFGCTSNDPMPSSQAQNMEDLEIPDGFDWDFTKIVEVELFAHDTENNPVQGVEVSLYKTQNNLAFKMSTNPIGRLKTSITMPESDNSVILEFDGQQVSVPVTGNSVYYEMTVNPVRENRDRGGDVYVPGYTSVYTLMFEDNWPVKGDYDFNDMVVESKCHLRYEGSGATNYLNYIEAEATVIASGATYHNGFNIIFETTAFPDISLGDIITYSAYDSEGQLPMTSEEVTAAYGTELIWGMGTSDHMQFKFFDDINDVMSPPQGYLAMNTDSRAPWVNPIKIKMKIDYAETHLILYSNEVIDLTQLNPYITVDNNPGYEIHLPGEFVTDNFSQSALFGTGDDFGGSFTTAEGYSWGLKLEGILEYPKEQVDIIQAYPRLAQYFAGELSIFEKWWRPHPDPDHLEGKVYDRGDMTADDQENYDYHPPE